MNEQVLQTRLERAEKKVKVLEELVEDRSRALYEALRESRNTASFLNEIAAAMPVAVLVYNQDGVITLANRGAQKLLGYSESDLATKPISRCFVTGEMPAIIGRTANMTTDGSATPVEVQTQCVSRSGEQIPVLVSAKPLGTEPATQGQAITVCTLQDLREREQRKADIRQSQKLQTLGRLTAGVAHEINTPVQCVSDSIHFLRDALGDLNDLIARYQDAVESASGGLDQQFLDVKTFEDEIDLDYIADNAPRALDRAADGLERVGAMCQSISEFAYPDSKGKSPQDINWRIKGALAIAHNEYRYVADLIADFGDLPLVPCHGDEISQTILNLVINAAHALGDNVATGQPRGKIWVQTRVADESVIIEVSDNGPGIPEYLRERVFGAFFTTKSASKGTGQGLALARNTIVDRHNGQLDLVSTAGRGTTFRIALPLGLPTPAAITLA